MNERIPPHNLEAERSVIGAALLSRDAMADAMEIVVPEDFYDSANKGIFEVMLEMYRNGKPIDIVTVCDELKKQKMLEASGGRAYIAELSGSVPSTSNAAEYATIVSEASSIRRLILSSDEIRELCYENKKDATDILDIAEKKIYSIAQIRQRSDYTPLKEILVRDIDILDEAVRNKGSVTGITTGFHRLDEITSGLQKSDLVILAARPAMGKTAFALNVAQNAAVKGGAHVLLFSLEMSKEQLGQRLLSMESRVDMENIKKGKVDRSDWDRILMAADTLSAADINIDDTPDLSVLKLKTNVGE